jgi:tetratricopeptide (TPR) repeat protein
MMRKLTAVLLAAIACAHGPAKQSKAIDAEAERRRLFELPPVILHKEARELMARGEFDAARARLEAYLVKAPDHAPALFDAGWVAERLGDRRSAADLYARALSRDPGNAGAAINLARLKDTPGESEIVLRAALEKAPDEPRLLNALAAALRAQHKLDDGAALVRRVLERHPGDATAYRNLAAIEADRGKLRLAESALENARKLDPKDGGIPNSLGVLAMRRDDVAAARGWFEEATRIDPAFAPAWANLGALALRYRDYAAAEQAYAKAEQLDPSHWEVRLARGWALEGLRKPREAREEYEKVLAFDPAQDDALYGKASALKAEGNLEGALAAFRQYAALPKAARLGEAQTQLAAIDLRLKGTAAAKPVPKSATVGLDLSKLPQGSDPAPASEPLPADDPPAVVR